MPTNEGANLGGVEVRAERKKEQKRLIAQAVSRQVVTYDTFLDAMVVSAYFRENHERSPLQPTLANFRYVALCVAGA